MNLLEWKFAEQLKYKKLAKTMTKMSIGPIRRLLHLAGMSASIKKTTPEERNP